MEYYKQAADAGNTNAMVNISMMYFNGMGVDVDYNEALKWTMMAKEHGMTGLDENIEMLKSLGATYNE